jgi:hypothetical protein
LQENVQLFAVCSLALLGFRASAPTNGTFTWEVKKMNTIRAVFGCLVGFAGFAGIILSLLIGIATMPDCGPWLTGEEFLECKNEAPAQPGPWLALFGSFAAMGLGCVIMSREHDASSIQMQRCNPHS